MKIMLIDDEDSVRLLVEFIVRKSGYEFFYASNGEEGLDSFDAVQPDLLILDVMMPGLNGFEVCTQLRQRDVDVPVIFLTAKGDIVDKTIAFRAGADDYLVKPFLQEELSLRIEALLRRSKSPEKKGLLASYLKYEGLEIDAKRHKVFVNGSETAFTPKEFHLLLMLASCPGEVFPREQLIRDVWGEEYIAESSSIAVLIRRIREKIEEDPSDPKRLQTVWHIGYKFEA